MINSPDYSDRVNSRKLPSYETEFISEPNFDPTQFNGFLNCIIRNEHIVFSYKMPDVLIGIHEDRCFYTVSDDYPMSAPDPDGEHYHSTGVACLKAVYVLPSARGKGVQHRLLKRIGMACFGSKSPCLAFVKPFSLPNEKPDDDIGDALVNFLTGDHLVYGDNETERVKQRRRFEKAGWQNVPYQWAELTEPEDHYLAVPKNLACETTKRIIEIQKNERNAVS